MQTIRLFTLFASLSCAAVFAQTPSSHPGMGSMPYSGGTAFRVWAPFASSAAVAGEFNDWHAAPMAREPSTGNWSVDIAGARPGQRYKYVFNGNIWKRDPRARKVTHSSGDSVIYDPAAFDWGSSKAPVLPPDDVVIYQLHIGTFAGITPPATFDDAIPRLDYIQRLGATVVQLMPVNEFPGGKSWGYNPSDLFAIETDYGGPDALKRFVRAAHERGLAVFVDVVHNHYGPTDLDLWGFDGWSENGLGGIYFYNDGRAHTPWGSTRPDYGRPEVRQFVRDQVFMFADEYRVDGFRWDSVYHIVSYSEQDSSTNPQGVQMLHDINLELAQTRPRLLRIAEDHAFGHDMLFNAQWDIGYRWALFHQVADAWDYERNMRTVMGALSDWPELRRVAFTEAHDYVAGMNYGRTRVPSHVHPEDPNSLWARKRALLGGAIVMTTPGIPMFFQGQEMNETLSFHDDVPLRWNLAQKNIGIVRAYRDLIHLRRNLSGRTSGLKGTGIFVHHVDNDNKVVAFTRWDKGGPFDDVLVVANFSSRDFTWHDYSIQFPSAGTWYRIFNSDSKQYGADFGDIGPSQLEATGTPPSAIVDMGKYSLQIFSKTPPKQNPRQTQ